MHITYVALPTKKWRFFGQIHDWKHVYLVFFYVRGIYIYLVRCFVIRKSAINSSLTSNPKVHHPAIDSLVLSLQCGKATAVFVSSRHRVSLKLENVVPGRWIWSFSYILLWPSVFYCSSIDKQYSYARVFFEKSHDHETFFCSSTALTHSSVFLSTFLCLLRHVSSRLRRG